MNQLDTSTAQIAAAVHEISGSSRELSATASQVSARSNQTSQLASAGQERLATDMGVTDRSVRTYLQELATQQFLTIKQRGLGKPNLYELNLIASATNRKNFPVKTGTK